MFALVFLQASVASLLAGACTWLLLRTTARIWPALEARRAPWLLGAAAVAGTLALGVLPSSARPSLVPAIELPAVWSSAVRPGPAGHGAARADDPAANGDDAVFDDHGAIAIAPAPALLWLGYLWFSAYTAGLALAGVRWIQARRRLNALLAASQRLDRFQLAAHAGFASLHRELPQVREIDAPIAPMLVGLLRPILLLPRHLRDFDPAQQRLVVEHELTHIARRDPLWLHASLLLQAMQWFNPLVTSLGKRMAWAQELGCDRSVLQGRPPAQRRAYAAALVTQLRLQCGPGDGSALAFGGSVVDAVAARIGLIRDGVPAMPRAVAGALAWAALPAVLMAGVMLQPALAWRLDSVASGNAAATPAQSLPRAAVASGLPADLPRWQAPMAKLRVSAFFGILHAPTGRQHGGMDFAAPTGTAVVAPAQGVVVASTTHYMGEDKWGEVVAIEHANGLRSLYAHLDKRLVKEGERVAAGQQIGTSGASGKVTGPHLHMEVSRNGDNIDPQILLGKLEDSATRTALQRLKASRAN
jgi:hypothetical protein